MINIRTYLAAMAMVAAGMTATAQDNSAKMFVNPDDIVVKDGKAKVEVWYNTNITTLNTFQFNLNLPEGFTIETNSRGKEIFTLNPDDEVVYDHSILAGNHLSDTPPYYIVLGYSGTNSYLSTGEHWLFSFNLLVPSDFTFKNNPDGVTCSLSDILMVENIESDPDHPVEYWPENSEFTIMPSDVPTAIETITANEDGDEEEMIFDLHGVRVYRPLLPGFYIINGEKQFVK